MAHLARWVRPVAWLGMAMLLDSLDSAIADVPPIRWRTDYAAVMADAENARGMMVVYFDDRSDPCIRFEQEASSNMGIAARLTATCCVRLPMDAEISVGGQPIRLIDHPAFTPLKGGPGLAILDFADPEPANRGRVVKTLNFSSGRTCTADDLGLLPRQPGDSRPGAGLGWLTDYGKAVETAQQDNRMLLVYFYREDGGGGCRQFQSETLADAAIAAGLERYVLLKLPTAAEVSLAGANTVLLKHPSLAEMVGLPGIAIIDYSDPQAPYHGQVVSTFPFLRGRAYTREQMNVILDLPPGKLTQRTLIYAIKTHPERPQSTRANSTPTLRRRRRATPNSRPASDSRATMPGQRDFNGSTAACRGACWQVRSAPRVGPVRVCSKPRSIACTPGGGRQGTGARSGHFTLSSPTTCVAATTESGTPRAFLANAAADPLCTLRDRFAFRSAAVSLREACPQSRPERATGCRAGRLPAAWTRFPPRW